MNRTVTPFLVILTAVLGVAYVYTSWRADYGTLLRVLLALPYLLVWCIPVLYWVGEREARRPIDHVLQVGGYIAMGWLSFLLVCTIGIDLLRLATQALDLPETHDLLVRHGGDAVLLLSLAAITVGAVHASGSPRVRHVDIKFPDLPVGLAGFRIVQISDLHVGPTIKTSYVQRVVQLANEQQADLVALTGDIVDGKVSDLAAHVAPLAELTPKERVFFITGNHEYYADAPAWLTHFASFGHHVLTNTNRVFTHKGARLLVGGVLDPAARIQAKALGPDIAAALGPDGLSRSDFRLLLAHNPKLAAGAAQAGFDLQLSGHTHAGQFFPWTLVTRLVHAPHFAGLSREGRLAVYVSAGTGTWGPPVRLGTRPELTVIRLLRD